MCVFHFSPRDDNFYFYDIIIIIIILSDNYYFALFCTLCMFVYFLSLVLTL
jgi:hypothetical protein